MTKLSEVDVVAIREARASGSTLKSLAERFGVSIGTIQPVVYGKTWRGAGGPISPPKPTLTAEQVAAIRDRNRSGESSAALAEAFGVTRSTINDVVARRTWRLL